MNRIYWFLKLFYIIIRYDKKKYFTDSSYRLQLNYKIGHYLFNNPFRGSDFLWKYYQYKQITKRNCQISFKAKLGNNILFTHPIGVVIGDGVEIGDNVKIWQGVTLGSHGKKEQKLAYPTVGNNVKIFSGAKIIGAVKIGDNAIIGANAVVLKDVPADSIAVGIPAKILSKNNENL